MPYMPYVIEERANGECSYDVFSRLLKDRIIFLTGEINDMTADLVIAQMLFLESQDPDKDISLYINSPGGSVSAGMAIYDTMQFIKPDVATICFGMAASMASVLLMAGAKGKRFALSHSEVLIHQPLGGMMGQASDIEIHARHLLRTREEMYKVIMLHTGQTREKIVADTDRDTYLTAEEALAYGIIDSVVTKRP
ncbi:ATP-dependent Clp protease proteolytic subunit [uncultured Succiniclasticum sp.]|uniref:ATP-dependent Clp protease proteolytic subunit n=1 Tax=uncultured Succiniclasticum sp. TaxID=1500547 RepID=UPI0025D28EE4|nr:ATP-dependent Clp protease proteolytic subunit [uncultured Succiniclasticum sp.]